MKKFQATNGVELYRVCMPESVDLGLAKSNLVPGPADVEATRPDDDDDDDDDPPPGVVAGAVGGAALLKFAPKSDPDPKRTMKLSERVREKRQLAKLEKDKNRSAAAAAAGGREGDGVVVVGEEAVVEAPPAAVAMRGPAMDPYDFNKLQRAGAKMGLDQLGETAKRRRDQKAEAEIKIEEEFVKKQERASNLLQAVAGGDGGDGDGDGGGGKSKKAKAADKNEAATDGTSVSLAEAQDMMKKDAGATRDLDEEIRMMQVPNTSFQPQENDGIIMKMTGGSKVYIYTYRIRLPSQSTSSHPIL